MVARRRLLTSLKELLFGFGFVLLYAAGLPLFFTSMGVEWGFLPTWRSWGTRLLVAAPFLLLLLFWRQWQWITGRYRRPGRKLEGEGTTYYLLPRADAKAVRADRVTLWGRVGEVLPRDEHLSWEVHGSSEGVRFALRSTPGVDRALLTQVTAEWPGTQARLTQTADDPLAADERPGWWCELRPRSAERPLVPVAPDPLLPLLVELGRLPDGVTAGVQLVVRGDPYTRQQLGSRAAKVTYKQASQGRGKYRLPVTLEERRTTHALDERAQRQFLEVRLQVWARASGEEMARSVSRSLARALLAQYGPVNPLQQVAEGAGTPQPRAFPPFAGRPWADSELGALAHLVGEDARELVRQLACAPANPLPPSPACRVPKGVRLSPRLRRRKQAPAVAVIEAPTTAPEGSEWIIEEGVA